MKATPNEAWIAPEDLDRRSNTTSTIYANSKISNPHILHN